MHFLCSLFRHLSPPHDLPQIAENRHGVGRNEFRVLDDSRSHKSPENVAVQRIEKTIAVYNPEVVGSSHAPQSQNRLISMKSDGFSAFASKGFRRNNAILQNLQLPQTMTHTGQKTCLGATLPCQGFSAVWNHFSTFSLVVSAWVLPRTFL